MTADEQRVKALMEFGFTERQARFLVLVMRHAGVCVPRQYASFAGIANGGEKCNAFFEKLSRRGYAVACDCVHNRARFYHVHHKPLYRAIGEPESRCRGPVLARRAVERLMLLDAVLASPDLNWRTTKSEKGAYVTALTVSRPAGNPPDVPARVLRKFWFSLASPGPAPSQHHRSDFCLCPIDRIVGPAGWPRHAAAGPPLSAIPIYRAS